MNEYWEKYSHVRNSCSARWPPRHAALGLQISTKTKHFAGEIRRYRIGRWSFWSSWFGL